MGIHITITPALPPTVGVSLICMYLKLIYVFLQREGIIPYRGIFRGVKILRIGQK